MKLKPLPIGIDKFEKLIKSGAYYVDKTKLIQKVIDATTEVSLFTRPRRFGKSLNLSMLQAYFEKSEQDNIHLFEGLYISKVDESYTRHLGAYPVINLDFKEGKQCSYEESYACICKNIVAEYTRHLHVISYQTLTAAEIFVGFIRR